MKDLNANGERRPLNDSEQNYTLTSSSEMGDYTTIEFNRKRDTGDDKDMQFMVSLDRSGICHTHSFHNLITPENS